MAEINEELSSPQMNANGVMEYPLQSSRFHDSNKYFIVLRVMFAAMDTLFYGVGSLCVTQYYWRRVNSRL